MDIIRNSNALRKTGTGEAKEIRADSEKEGEKYSKNSISKRFIKDNISYIKR